MKVSLPLSIIAVVMLSACSSTETQTASSSAQSVPPKFSKPSNAEIRQQRKIADKKQESAENKHY